MTTTILGLLLLGATACGSAAASGDATPDTTVAPGGAAGACLVGSTDCADDPSSVDAWREEARGLLGMNEADLPTDVRIGRRGPEELPLTLDHVEGRRTVQLDDVDGSGFRVVAVTLELADGNETFELQPG